MKPILLCLHGWGGSKESFTELRAAMKDDDVLILTPDLPGFGGEPEPRRPWTVDDYADWVVEWLSEQLTVNSDQSVNSKLLTDDLYLLGHSHGGRIAIKLAAANRLPIKHLYLCAAAGIRRPRHFKRIIGLLLAKIGKVFLAIPGMRSLQPVGKKLLYRLIRVHDYENASPIMRDTLISVTREDLRPFLSLIHTPTDIFWGTKDGMTPVADSAVMHQKIAGSQLHVYPGITHRVHRDKAMEIAAVIRSHIKG